MGTGLKGVRANIRLIYWFSVSICFSFIDFEDLARRRSLSYLSSTCQVIHKDPAKKRVMIAICLFSFTRDILSKFFFPFAIPVCICCHVEANHVRHFDCILSAFISPCSNSVVRSRFFSADSVSMRLRMSCGDSVFLLDIIIIRNWPTHILIVMQEDSEEPIYPNK